MEIFKDETLSTQFNNLKVNKMMIILTAPTEPPALNAALTELQKLAEIALDKDIREEKSDLFSSLAEDGAKKNESEENKNIDI